MKGLDCKLAFHKVLLCLALLVPRLIDAREGSFARLRDRTCCDSQRLVEQIVHPARIVDFNVAIEEVGLVTLAQATSQRKWIHASSSWMRQAKWAVRPPSAHSVELAL